MAKLHLLPDIPAAQQLVSGLLGKPATMKNAPPGAPIKPVLVAAYATTHEGVLGALALMDLGMAAYAGAALTLLPPAAAHDTVKSGKLSDAMAENAREILNVAANLFILPECDHVRLHDVYTVPGTMPPEITQALAKPARRLDLVVSISGYGDGRLTLLRPPT